MQNSLDLLKQEFDALTLNVQSKMNKVNRILDFQQYNTTFRALQRKYGRDPLEHRQHGDLPTGHDQTM